MPKRRRADRNDNEAESITFSIPEDSIPSSSTTTTTPKPTTTLSPPSSLSEQVFNISEWTVEADRVSTSNTLFSTMVESAPDKSSNESSRDIQIPGAYHNYYDVIDVSDFQPPPEPLQPSRSSITESSKNLKVRLLFSFFLIAT